LDARGVRGRARGGDEGRLRLFDEPFGFRAVRREGGDAGRQFAAVRGLQLFAEARERVARGARFQAGQVD
jgi:hypothetical protein